MISWSVLMATTIKVSIVLGVALLATACLRQRSAALRHWLLSLAVACAALVPLLQGVAPSWHLRSAPSSAPPAVAAARDHDRASSVTTSEVSVAVRPAGSSAVQRPPQDLVGRMTSSQVLGGLWIAGMGISLGLLLVGLARLAWLASGSRRILGGRWAELAKEIADEYGLRRPVLLLQSERGAFLVTWGLLRSKVILPASAREWSEDRIRVVLAHELAHVARGDWLVQMTAELLRSVYWFNPLMWITCRRLRLESEHACDDAVLNRGVERLDYATHLLQVARTLAAQRHTRLPAPAMARPSSLQRRMNAMLNVGLDRNPLTRTARLTTAVTLLTITLFVAGYGVSAQTPSGTVSGTVHDQSGVAVSNVSVALTRAEGSRPVTITGRTDDSGSFEFDLGLPAGTYALEATFPGFKKIREELTVEAGQHVERDLTLQIGSLQETITVAWGTRELPPPPPAAPPPPRKIERPDPSRDSPAALPSSGVPHGGAIEPPKKIKDVDPVYPAELAEAGVEGRIDLKARIDTSGAVTGIEVLGSPHPGLANAAIEAVSQWQYTPTLLNGAPVEVEMDVMVTFSAEL
ncbi:MAG: TonB family protein [Vicinamibacteraceae bacterium]